MTGVVPLPLHGEPPTVRLESIKPSASSAVQVAPRDVRVVQPPGDAQLLEGFDSFSNEGLRLIKLTCGERSVTQVGDRPRSAGQVTSATAQRQALTDVPLRRLGESSLFSDQVRLEHRLAALAEARDDDSVEVHQRKSGDAVAGGEPFSS